MTPAAPPPTVSPWPLLPLDKPLYETDEAAAVLRIGRSTLYRRLQEGTLRYVKVGARTFVRRDDLEAMLSEQSRRGRRG
jgi:excisionase family DNA binding protein